MHLLGAAVLEPRFREAEVVIFAHGGDGVSCFLDELGFRLEDAVA